jgi:hypothetical protein
MPEELRLLATKRLITRETPGLVADELSYPRPTSIQAIPSPSPHIIQPQPQLRHKKVELRDRVASKK